MRKADGEALAVSALGQVDGLAISTEKMNGRFESRADIDPGLKNAVVSAKIEQPNFPLGSVPLSSPPFPEAPSAILKALMLSQKKL